MMDFFSELWRRALKSFMALFQTSSETQPPSLNQNRIVITPNFLSSEPYISETPDREILVQTLIKALEDLKNNPNPLDTSRQCEKVLQTTFDIFTANMAIEKEEERTIADLIADVLPKLEISLEDLAHIDIDLGSQNLELRSGAQFFVDNFKDFCTSSGKILKDSFDQLQEGLEEWDEVLILWKNQLYPSLDVPNESLSDYIRPAEVPNSHVWWDEEI